MQRSRSPSTALLVTAMIGVSALPTRLRIVDHRLVAIHHWHHDVHQDDADVLSVLENVARGWAAVDRDDVHSAACGQFCESERVVGVILDDQRGRAGHGPVVEVSFGARGGCAGVPPETVELAHLHRRRSPIARLKPRSGATRASQPDGREGVSGRFHSGSCCQPSVTRIGTKRARHNSA
jgi:hypothetical protein